METFLASAICTDEPLLSLVASVASSADKEAFSLSGDAEPLSMGLVSVAFSAEAERATYWSCGLAPRRKNFGGTREAVKARGRGKDGETSKPAELCHMWWRTYMKSYSFVGEALGIWEKEEGIVEAGSEGLARNDSCRKQR